MNCTAQPRQNGLSVPHSLKTFSEDAPGFVAFYDSLAGQEQVKKRNNVKESVRREMKVKEMKGKGAELARTSVGLSCDPRSTRSAPISKRFRTIYGFGNELACKGHTFEMPAGPTVSQHIDFCCFIRLPLHSCMN